MFSARLRKTYAFGNGVDKFDAFVKVLAMANKVIDVGRS